MVDPEVLTRNSLTKDIYDLLGFQTHEGFFQFVVIGFVSLIIFMFVYKYVYQRSSVLFVAELQKDVQKFLYDQVASTPYSDLVDMHPAKYTRFLLSQWQRYVVYVQSVMNILRVSFVSLCVLFLLGSIDPVIVISALLVFTLYYAIMLGFFHKKARRLAEEDVLLDGGITQIFQEYQENAPLLSFTRQRSFFDINFLRFQKKAVKARYRRMMFQNVPAFALEAIFMVGVLFFFLYVVTSDQLSWIPHLSLFGVGWAKVMLSLGQVYTNSILVTMHRKAYTDIQKMMKSDTKTETEEIIPKTQIENLRIGNVSFSYENDTSVLENLGLVIWEGEKVCILGKSGSGKTTLLEIIAWLRKAPAASFELNGAELKNPLHAHVRVGYVPQRWYLLSASLRENIAFGVEADDIDDARVRTVAVIAWVDEFAENLPEKYATDIWSRGLHLSVGERQRVTIARTLYHDPDILIMDESTSAIDRVTTEQIIENIFGLGIPIIFVTHKEWLAKSFDRTYILDKGSFIDPA